MADFSLFPHMAEKERRRETKGRERREREEEGREISGACS
jgi:hypothetical protein